MDQYNAERIPFTSNKGIYEAFYEELKKPRQSVSCKLRAAITTRARAILSVLNAAQVRRILRACFATASLIGLVGTAGALECGALSPVSCLLLAGAQLCLLYRILKPRDHKAETAKRIADTKNS